MRKRRVGASVLAVGLAVNCTSETPAVSNVEATRDTLANGAILVQYGALPSEVSRAGKLDLTIGSLSGDARSVFGDIRGLDAGADGSIYVLDYQASEVRVFDREGSFVRVLAAEGEGPGEITSANGIILVGDSLLWIQDHGKWSMIGLLTNGTEIARVPMPVLSYGYVWNGTVDDAGRIWKPDTKSDTERRSPPEEGLTENGYRLFMKWFDPANSAADSVFIGVGRVRTHVSRNDGGGHTYRGIPFDPRAITVVDHQGAIWHTDNTSYDIVRLDATGDSALVLRAAVEPLPVTSADRERVARDFAEDGPSGRRVAKEMLALIGGTKPVIERLIPDDAGGLWVQRVVPRGESPLFDAFDREGQYLGSMRLDFQPAGYGPMRIRRGQMFTVTRDSLDVPYVARAILPS